MSDESILEYLVANSEIARNLNSDEEPISLEVLLAHQSDQERCTNLLSKLPGLEKDQLNIYNCVLDNTFPYNSIAGLSIEDLELLAELCGYLMLSDDLRRKINEIIVNGCDIKKYPFDLNDVKKVTNSTYWASIGEIRGLQWIHKYGYPWDIDTCGVAFHKGHLDCFQYACAHGCPDIY